VSFIKVRDEDDGEEDGSRGVYHRDPGHKVETDKEEELENTNQR